MTVTEAQLAAASPELRDAIIRARERVMAAEVGGERIARGRLSVVTKRRNWAVRRALKRLGLEDLGA